MIHILLYVPGSRVCHRYFGAAFGDKGSISQVQSRFGGRRTEIDSQE
jgi:hypothetical protein